ncbi:hypothetical protein BSL78_08081 [Apostichopus japonicus]|uniref:DUF7630 domain-containing protein n=1 Tax=Stichopus japonicus TaxID=307972 RepID=A0A2G8L438_STIJA|nr:hypothetical protein BSL78_08081 [Apostichopus japonicus]
MLNWSFPGSSVASYRNFVANLRLPIDPSYLQEKYDGDIPRVFKCPRSESCPNDNDSLAGNCANGYNGWLCTNCEPGYSSVLTLCVACPGLMLLIVESCVLFIVCVLARVLLSWQIKQKAGKDSQTRSFLDFMISRINILLGFYQFIGEIFTSLHDIHWTGPLVLTRGPTSITDGGRIQVNQYKRRPAPHATPLVPSPSFCPSPPQWAGWQSRQTRWDTKGEQILHGALVSDTGAINGASGGTVSEAGTGTASATPVASLAAYERSGHKRARWPVFHTSYTRYPLYTRLGYAQPVNSGYIACSGTTWPHALPAHTSNKCKAGPDMQCGPCAH